MERQCRCPAENKCSISPAADDGYTLADKTRQYKMCEPIKKLPRCRLVFIVINLILNVILQISF